MKRKNEILPVVLLDALIGFVLAAPFLLTPPSAGANAIYRPGVRLLQGSIIVLMYIYFRRKYPKLTPLQRKIQHYALLGLAAFVGFCVFCILLFCIFMEMLGTPLR